MSQDNGPGPTATPVRNSSVSVNLDAAWLRQLVTLAQTADSEATDGSDFTPHLEDSQLARLLRIADNIERLDIAAAHAYQLGITEAEARVYARSNLSPQSESISKRRAKTLLDALNQFTGQVTKVPVGERALDDKPQDFNARRKTREAKAPVLAIDLDLSDI